MIKGWNYAGGKVRVNEPSFPSPTRGLISRLALYLAAVQLEAFVMKFQFYTLPVPSRPHNSTLDHYGHERNSQIFVTIYFCTRFFCDKKICINIFCITKFNIYFGVCCFFAIKNRCTNICDTNKCTVMQKILMQKMMLQKYIQKHFWGLFLQQQFLCQKFLRKKFLCNSFLSIYFCNGLFCGIYLCIFD